MVDIPFTFNNFSDIPFTFNNFSPQWDDNPNKHLPLTSPTITPCLVLYIIQAHVKITDSMSFGRLTLDN